MKITYWSDYACPYCYIGETHLKQAVEALGAAQSVEIEMKAFELNPYASKDYTGTTVDRFAVKYGLTNAMAAKRIQQIDETGRQAGLDFNYGQTRYTSTFDAHRLTKLARGKPDRTLADRLSERLYRAYFTENLELADPEVLVRIAVSEGLDETEVRAMLASDDYADDVRQDEKQAQEYRIHGVPYFVLAGKYSVPGAMPVEQMEPILKKLLEEEKLAEEKMQGTYCTPEGCLIGGHK